MLGSLSVAGSERPARYELLGELASGGMATVYLGRRRSGAGARLVAVKSIRQELAADDAFAAMFLDEATLTAKIKHPNVVATLDVVSAEGKLLIVMEYVEGLSLAKLLELAWGRKASVPPAVAVRVLTDVLRGLHAAHELVDERGRALSVVHRDVSPQNVMIGLDGVARILDFGVAKAASQRHVTERGEIKGKLSYMPPEQQLGEAVDRRSDVYAAGVVLWELLVGRRLFTARDDDELARLVFEGRVDPPSLASGQRVPAALDHVVLRALAHRREDRWWSAEQMANELRDALEPAPRGDVVATLKGIARDELAARARHVSELDSPRAAKLEREAQTVLDVLTARGADAVPEPSPFAPSPGALMAPAGDAPVTRVESPAARDVARAAESRASRRAERRAKRRRRQILVLAAIGLLVVLLMIVALVLGWKAREAEVGSPAVRDVGGTHADVHARTRGPSARRSDDRKNRGTRAVVARIAADPAAARRK
ncbi:MAG: serine/threonine protein kinase [Labilithrix sp.]|nr:serine/threonine protein kinase [Labilithrix sp.]